MDGLITAGALLTALSVSDFLVRAPVGLSGIGAAAVAFYSRQSDSRRRAAARAHRLRGHDPDRDRRGGGPGRAARTDHRAGSGAPRRRAARAPSRGQRHPRRAPSRTSPGRGEPGRGAGGGGRLQPRRLPGRGLRPAAAGRPAHRAWAVALRYDAPALAAAMAERAVWTPGALAAAPLPDRARDELADLLETTEATHALMVSAAPCASRCSPCRAPGRAMTPRPTSPCSASSPPSPQPPPHDALAGRPRRHRRHRQPGAERPQHPADPLAPRPGGRRRRAGGRGPAPAGGRPGGARRRGQPRRGDVRAHVCDQGPRGQRRAHRRRAGRRACGRSRGSRSRRRKRSIRCTPWCPCVAPTVAPSSRAATPAASRCWARPTISPWSARRGDRAPGRTERRSQPAHLQGPRLPRRAALVDAAVAPASALGRRRAERRSDGDVRVRSGRRGRRSPAWRVRGAGRDGRRSHAGGRGRGRPLGGGDRPLSSARRRGSAADRAAFHRLWLDFASLGFSAAPMAVLADDLPPAPSSPGILDPAGASAYHRLPRRHRAAQNSGPKPRLPVSTLIV